MKTASQNHISVVCPTYNSALYIERTLESLFSQTVLPYEIIFTDDGSEDSTVEVLRSWETRFSGRSVKYSVLQNQHVGPGENRNRGIAAAQGSWVSFLDSDDYWQPAKIGHVYSVIEKNPRVNFVLHWEKYQKMDGEELVLKHGSVYDLNGSLGKQIYKNNSISTSAVTCKKEILESVGGFDKTLPVSQDYELWLRLSPIMKPYVIEEILGCYTEQPNSITARPYRRRYFPLMRILFRHKDKGGIPCFFYRALRASLSPQWGRDFLHWLKNEQRH